MQQEYAARQLRFPPETCRDRFSKNRASTHYVLITQRTLCETRNAKVGLQATMWTGLSLFTCEAASVGGCRKLPAGGHRPPSLNLGARIQRIYILRELSAKSLEVGTSYIHWSCMVGYLLKQNDYSTILYHMLPRRQVDMQGSCPTPCSVLLVQVHRCQPETMSCFSEIEANVGSDPRTNSKLQTQRTNALLPQIRGRFGLS